LPQRHCDDIRGRLTIRDCSGGTFSMRVVYRMPLNPERFEDKMVQQFKAVAAALGVQNKTRGAVRRSGRSNEA